MDRESLTGSRIRERRVMQGVKQADLAREIGISASYLNLIEHNRRRIGGKLLLDIAAALQVEPQALTDGAEAALLGALGEAAQAANLSAEDAGLADAFAGRFPGWAEALAASQRRVAALERTVETLSDRIAHDPHLADSMHELLTTAAAVRSTAEILADENGLEPEWQDRFHANLDADSHRLAQSAQSLVGYLEQTNGPTASSHSPQEEVELFLEARNFRFEELENGNEGVSAEGYILREGGALSEAARFILKGVIEQLQIDAKAIPLGALEKALTHQDLDPVALARSFGVPVVLMLRRLAIVPSLNAGLVVCDRSGTVIFRKSTDGFSVPRFDSCCPLWPLFAALGSSGTVLRERVGQLGRGQVQFDAYATTELASASAYNIPAPARGVMLLLPVPAGDSTVKSRSVGATCRICQHDNCRARREPSIMKLL
ncbi:helix-turn-helix domain-containing protein [Sulfitobacter donghicola]|uniref:Transcriptional regulator n=1 Tax=Sulfitobacter donghicola DSW-25 = KCTC 12864 = JCM 14565 TaxID=1300350 RepID=A0A073IKS4_9RHOB|nr:helix-turn-helix transcriptional regulator [Sulfitobacter donghicola]KEJ90175.1 transcriptional regulator [Sulfitobacter donghicola DSW-25 = KCTC 12864 = JCM 14565]KIN66663.1 Transcriptional regulator [Sulfitobacter donghicola DSW-25 = KCTC 12864 = JCM 14565]